MRDLRKRWRASVFVGAMFIVLAVTMVTGCGDNSPPPQAQQQEILQPPQAQQPVQYAPQYQQPQSQQPIIVQAPPAEQGSNVV